MRVQQLTIPLLLYSCLCWDNSHREPQETIEFFFSTLIMKISSAMLSFVSQIKADFFTASELVVLFVLKTFILHKKICLFFVFFNGSKYLL